MYIYIYIYICSKICQKCIWISGYCQFFGYIGGVNL